MDSATTNNWPRDFLELMGTSPLLRVLLIGLLILLLQIPITMIRGVVREREKTRDTAVQEVTSKWGGKQSLTGPWITVPYSHRWVETRQFGRQEEIETHTETRYATFLPETLHISGTVDSEVRYRGIFQIPVYALSLEVAGQFSQPDFSEWGVEGDDVLWDRAYFSLGISDARAITDQAVLTWDGTELGFAPGSGETSGGKPGIHASLENALEGEAFDFSFPLALNGSEGAFFTPFGRETEVELTSNWTEPSFQGNWLPSERSVDGDGFEASWSIPFLGRNYPQQWKTGADFSGAVASSQFGVKLLAPVDHYRMALRSVKYAALFLVLTFTTLWLFEILNKIRIHPVQYLLIGAGMCVFYLLELSLAEHIGFLTAYVVASSAIVVLIASYSVAVLKSTGRASIVGVVTAILYGYLYVLLKNQDYALLIGSIGLFVVIATIMYLTRKINWYPSKTPPEAPTPE